MEKIELQYKTIGDCFEERVQKAPEQVAVEFEGQKATWRELDELSDWLVLRFRFFGMKKGSRAAIWCGNCLQWVIVYLGLQKLGALTILINPGYQEEELYRVLAYAKIEYLFYGESFKEMVLPEVLERIDLKENPLLKQVIPIELQDAVDFMVEQAGKMTETDREAVREMRKQVEPKDVACMLFTSGTTSSPKGVMLTHYSLVNDAIATSRAMHWNSRDKICVMVPLFHCFGMTSCLLSGLVTGCSLYLMKYYRTINALEAIQNAGCTVLNGVPSMFLAMIHNRAFEDYHLESLQSGIIAGAPIRPEDYKRICEKLQMEHLQMSYGQTETSPGVSFSGYDLSIEEKCDNAGTPIAGVELCIWDARGVQYIYPDHETSCYIHGEIGVRGFPVMSHYYDRPEETRQILQEDGWLHTGDRGCMDENGQLHVEGRIGEMIIRGGENISPVEIEECILGMPQVREVKVIGVPQKVLFEEIAAAVVLNPGCELGAEQIREHARRHLAHYKVPKYVAFYEQLPMNASGKVKSGELKAQLARLAESLDG